MSTKGAVGLLSVFAILALFGVGAFAKLAAREAYCAVSPDHTICKYSRANQLGKCGQIKRRGLSATEIQQLLNAHNNKRRLIAKGLQAGQPRASNMVKMTWDAEAAAIAQRWVDQCVFGRDSKRDTVIGGTVYNGQNAWGSSGRSTIDVNSAVDAWFNGVKSFDPKDVGSYKFSTSTRHYTQVVWAQTTRIGCGFVHHGSQMILVCNYAPGGNNIGNSVYRVGNACTACPTPFTRCDDGLCGR